MEIVGLTQEIRVKENGAYETTEIVYARCIDCSKAAYSSVPYTEMDSLLSVSVQVADKKHRMRKIPWEQDMTTYQSDLFYTGYKQYHWGFTVPPKTAFIKVKTKRVNAYMATIPNLILSPVAEMDSIHHRIFVPSNLTFDIELVGDTAAFIYHKKEITKDGQTIIDLISINRAKESELTEQKTEKEAQELTYGRLLVLPKGETDISYLTLWSGSLYDSENTLDSSVKEEIQQLFKEKEDTIKNLFNYVRKYYKYISIENNIWAFKPLSINTVVTKKRGDCKGFANFFTAILRNLGYEAYNVITFNGDTLPEFNFKKLQDFNHVITMVVKGNDTLFLDATDPYSSFGYPAISNQHKPYLIITKDTQQARSLAIQYTPMKAKNSKFKYHCDLYQEEEELSGNCTLNLSGYANWVLKSYNEMEPKQQEEQFIQYLEMIHPKTKPFLDSITSAEENVRLYYKLKSNNLVFQQEEGVILLKDMLVRPTNKNSITDIEAIYGLNYAYQLEGGIKIHLENNYQNIGIQKKDACDNFSFSYHENLNQKVLKVNYVFTSNGIKTSAESRACIDEVLKKHLKVPFRYEMAP